MNRKIISVLLLFGLFLLVAISVDSSSEIQPTGSGIIFIDGQGFSVAPSKQFDFIISQPRLVCDGGLDG